MLDKPTLIVAVTFFLSGGLIVLGLGYPSYAKWRDAADSVVITSSAATSSGALESAPSSSFDNSSGREKDRERDDEEDGDDDDKKTTPIPSPKTSSVSPETTEVPVSSGTLLLTASEIAKHASASSCWISINGKVYDMTSHIQAHSGGAQGILSSCGKDGSTTFNTKGGNGSHSPLASSILQNFYIGELNGPKIK